MFLSFLFISNINLACLSRFDMGMDVGTLVYGAIAL